MEHPDGRRDEDPTGGPPGAHRDKGAAAQLARELKKAVLGHLVHTAIAPYPDEEALRGYQRLGARASQHRGPLHNYGADGWHRWPLGAAGAPLHGARPLVAPPSGFDPARHAREAEERRARVAFAYELAVAFKRIFPQEVVLQIHLWVFWG